MCEDFRYNPKNPRYYILQEDRDAIQKALKAPDLDKAIADGKFKLAVQKYDLDNKDMLGDQPVFYVKIDYCLKISSNQNKTKCLKTSRLFSYDLLDFISEKSNILTVRSNKKISIKVEKGE